MSPIRGSLHPGGPSSPSPKKQRTQQITDRNTPNLLPTLVVFFPLFLSKLKPSSAYKYKPVVTVIETISAAIERLIKHGATSLVVPGVIPSGCSPPILTMFADARPPKYDPETGCLRAHNELGIHHNTLLQDSLRRLRAKHPGVTIVYADFFSPVMEMIESPHKFGFRQDVLQVCCGGPGRYNYNDSVSCGDPGATACESPSSSLYFDGVHLTEPGYRYVADGWLNSINSAASANTGWCRSEHVHPCTD